MGKSTRTGICHILGQDSQNSLYWKKNLLEDTCGPGRDSQKIQTTTGPDHVWPEVWTKIGKAAQNRDKQEWKNEKPKLDNARRLRGIYYTEPWIHRNPWTCEEKIGKACGRGHAVQKGGSFQHHKLAAELNASHKVPKTTYGCMVESNESTRQRVEPSPPKNNEDQIAGRLFSMTNLHWKITPTLQQLREERTRNEKKWLNNEGVQGPLNQRPDFVEAKRELKRLHDEHVKETSERNTPIHPIQRTRRRRNQQFEGLEEYNYKVDRWTGWRSYPSKSQGNLRHPTSSSTQRKQHDDRKSNKSWNSWRSSTWTERQFLFVQRFFRLPEIWIPWQSTGSVDRYTCRTPHLHHMHSHCTEQTTCVPWLKGPEGSRRIVCQKHSLIHASCFTLRLTVQWTRALVLSHLPLLCYCRPLLRTQTCCPRIHLSTVKIHRRMVLLRNFTLSQTKRRILAREVRFCVEIKIVTTRRESFASSRVSELQVRKKVVFMAINADSDMLRNTWSPTRSRKQGGAKGSVAVLKEATQLGCVSQDSYPRKSILRESGKLGTNHAVKLSKGTWHQITIPSRGIIQKCAPHEQPCFAAILDCRMIHGILWVHQETFLNDYLFEKDYSLLSSKI